MSLDTFDPILSEQELAAWLKTSRPTLQRQRCDGTGPDFIQLSARRIGYRKSAIDAWLSVRTINRVGGVTAPLCAPNSSSGLEQCPAVENGNVA